MQYSKQTHQACGHRLRSSGMMCYTNRIVCSTCVQCYSKYNHGTITTYPGGIEYRSIIMSTVGLRRFSAPLYLHGTITAHVSCGAYNVIVSLMMILVHNSLISEAPYRAVNRCIHKMWYRHKMEHYSATKKVKVDSL